MPQMAKKRKKKWTKQKKKTKKKKSVMGRKLVMSNLQCYYNKEILMEP